MTRKIAFLSSAIIKIPKESEEILTMEFEGIKIEYKHPVLYMIRQTKRDKDYIYLYSGKPTFVIMKVKEAHIEKFIECTNKVLSIVGIDSEDIEALTSEMLLYCRLSCKLEELYLDVLGNATEKFKSYVFALDIFDPLLRRKMVRPLAREITILTIKEKAKEYYLKMPTDLRSKVSFKIWLRFVLSEIDKRSIIKNILKGAHEK